MQNHDKPHVGPVARVIAAISVATLAISPAMAEEEGLYAKIGGGLSLLEDVEFSGGGTSVEAETDLGFGAVAGFGYQWPHNWRTELEATYTQNDIDSISGVSGGGGDVDTFAAMVNVLYDFDFGSKVRPYLGGGIGVANVDFDSVGPIAGGVVDENDRAFAYQFIAGYNYEIRDGLDWFVDYRYFQTEDLDVNTSTGVFGDAEYTNHQVFTGLKWAFWRPQKPMMEPEPMPQPMAQPAPPPPPPAPPMPQKFLVFFDWDRADLKPEAVSIIQDAAAAAKRGEYVQIVATGHADRSGSASYNMGLSQRRADNVKAQLVREGIAANEIATVAKGETDPLVPTDDGVREPQNRRVEIVFEK